MSGRSARSPSRPSFWLLAPAVAAPGPRTVEVNDDYFIPSSLTVRKGTMVRFNWVGINEHNVVKSTGPGPVFESDPMQGAGVLYKRRFTKPGRYTLICSIHDGMDMSLKVKRKRRRG